MRRRRVLIHGARELRAAWRIQPAARFLCKTVAAAVVLSRMFGQYCSTVVARVGLITHSARWALLASGQITMRKVDRAPLIRDLMDLPREIFVNLGLALIYVVVASCLILVGDLAAFSWLIKDAGASFFP